MDIKDLDDKGLANLIDNRWKSSDTVWDAVNKTYPINLRYYKGSPEWLEQLPRRQPRVRNNRIFANTEAVINSLIANLPKPTILATRDTPQAKELATVQEKYFGRKYDDLNVKETMRKGLRNLYFGRLIVLKPFWDSKINDFNVRAVDPRKVRVQKNSTKEDDSEFCIEEVDDLVTSLIRRFPNKKADILREAGYTDEEKLFIDNPSCSYKEAWIRDYVVFKYKNIILDKLPNPYWDWDGIMLTEDEESQLSYADGEQRRNILQQAKLDQPNRQPQQAPQPNAVGQDVAPETATPATDPAAAALQQGGQTGAQGETGTVPLQEYQDTPQTYSAYYFNHFSYPRKPYIYATIFNNENSPIGQTDMITQAIPLQVDADETKRNITRNSRLVNGVWKIDANVMGKSDAQRLDTEVGGIIWGKGVKDGATREVGTPLPAFVFDNYRDSLAEIDNIMAASSAFRGEAEGVNQTKGGILALIDQSNLRLNELTQIVDYVNYELFNWFYQLAKVRYTEHHYAKVLGKDQAVEILTIMQDDLQDGSEIKVIAGKTLPEDKQFRYQQAQADVQKGVISPVDYFEAAGYDNPTELARNKVLYDLNPAIATGVSPEQLQQYAPPKAPEEKPPAISINYADLPPDGQVQLAAQIGIQLDPHIIIAEKIAEQHAKNASMVMDNQTKPGTEANPKAK